MHPCIDIIYRPTEAAKIVFDYTIYDPADHSVFATGYSVQVFMDTDYQLVLYSPPFYDEWRKRFKVFDVVHG
jgi:acyl-CoA thioester hydrolase